MRFHTKVPTVAARATIEDEPGSSQLQDRGVTNQILITDVQTLPCAYPASSFFEGYRVRPIPLPKSGRQGIGLGTFFVDELSNES